MPTPPVGEQDEIIRSVEAMFVLADAIEGRVAAATRQADRLTPTVLAKAFKGELVPTEAELARLENRDYEPASALMKRIQEALKQPKPARCGRGGENMAKRGNDRPAATRRSLYEVLREEGKPLTPERLFDLAGFDEGSVDVFYEQLRQLLVEGKIRESRPDKKDVTLEAVGT